MQVTLYNCTNKEKLYTFNINITLHHVNYKYCQKHQQIKKKSQAVSQFINYIHILEVNSNFI